MSSVTPIPESPWRPSDGWRGWDFQRPRTIAALERIGDVLILPLVAAYRARLISFRSAAQLLSLVPGAAGVLLRRVWYRATVASCGKRLRVGFGAGEQLQDPAVSVARVAGAGGLRPAHVRLAAETPEPPHGGAGDHAGLGEPPARGADGDGVLAVDRALGGPDRLDVGGGDVAYA